jgi:hypothetical protein
MTFTGTAGCFKESFTIFYQMLLCGECYENVYTFRRTNYPPFKVLTSPHSNSWNTIVRLFLKHPTSLHGVALNLLQRYAYLMYFRTVTEAFFHHHPTCRVCFRPCHPERGSDVGRSVKLNRMSIELFLLTIHR